MALRVMIWIETTVAHYLIDIKQPKPKLSKGSFECRQHFAVWREPFDNFVRQWN